MGFLENAEAVAYTVAFVVPGFIWTQWERKFAPQSGTEWTERLLCYFVFTLINYAFWLMIWLPALINRTVATGLSTLSLIQWVLTLFVGPMILGSLSGLAKRFDWLGKFLNRFRIPINHHIETGWEFAFSRRQQALVRVVLKNGKEYYGWMGARSCASTAVGERDLFLQEVLVAKVTETSVELDTEPDSLGMWLPQSEIQSLRFYKHEGGSHVESKRKKHTS